MSLVSALAIICMATFSILAFTASQSLRASPQEDHDMRNFRVRIGVAIVVGILGVSLLLVNALT